MIDLDILALQAKQVERQIETLRREARAHQGTGRIGEFDSTAAYCDGAILLIGQVWAGFQHAHRQAEAARKRMEITDADRAVAEDSRA